MDVEFNEKVEFSLTLWILFERNPSLNSSKTKVFIFYRETFSTQLNHFLHSIKNFNKHFKFFNLDERQQREKEKNQKYKNLLVLEKIKTEKDKLTKNFNSIHTSLPFLNPSLLSFLPLLPRAKF